MERHKSTSKRWNNLPEVRDELKLEELEEVIEEQMGCHFHDGHLSTGHEARLLVWLCDPGN